MSSGSSAGGVPVLYVTADIISQAQLLLNRGTGSSTRDGIELLLVNGTANSSSIPSHDVNAGSLLQKGLTFLSNSPYDSLDLSFRAELSEVKKAYKRMALKYHPDKNPSTTPLFHVIQGAYEKLMDGTVERNATTPTAPPQATSPTKPKEKSTTFKSESFHTDSSSDSFKRYQSKPNKYTAYRKPEETSKGASVPKFEQKPKTNSSTQWGQSRPNMAGDNDPLPGQNTYEGFRGYSEYPKECPSFPSSESTKRENSNPTRRKSHSSVNSKDSKLKRPEDDTTERSRRRQEEYEAANKRIAERRAKQQQRKMKDDEPPITTGSKTTESFFSLPIPTGVAVNLTKESESSVDITWNKYSKSKSLVLKLELSWRIPPLKQSNSSWKVGQSKSIENNSTDWIVSSQLISTHTVRKKNLKLGTKYEFRVRYVLVNDDATCEYQRGDWSESVSITLPDQASNPALEKSLPKASQPQTTSQSTPLSQPRGESESKFTITVTGMRARGLHSRTFFGISNPYVACTIGNRRLKTGVMSHTNEPNWSNEQIVFPEILSLNQTLHVEIFDKELISRKSLLGEISISLSDLRLNDEFQSWMILTGGSSEESDSVSEIYLSIQCHTGTRRSTCNRRQLNNETLDSGFIDPITSKQSCSTTTSEASASASASTSVLEYFQLSPPPLSSKPTKDYLHPVYKDFLGTGSTHLIGYLTPLKFVLVDTGTTTSEDSSWCYVQCHYGPHDQTTFLNLKTGGLFWGWCVSRDETNHHKYLTSVSEDYQSPATATATAEESGTEEDNESDDEDEARGGDDQIPLWYQLRDESSGYFYYYNDKTGESEWESPEWIEEFDPISGSRYYTHLDPEDGTALETTWSKPSHFARLVREMT